MGRRVHVRFTPAQAGVLVGLLELVLNTEDPGEHFFFENTREWRVAERALNRLNTDIEKARGGSYAGTGPERGADHGADGG